MPNLSQENFALPSTFGFSGTNVKQLAQHGTANKTLVTLVLDASGSVDPFWAPMVKAVESVVKSLSLSPRADSLVLRMVLFNQALREYHGFRPLAECHLAEYEVQKLGRAYGGTALFDVSYNAIESTTKYARELSIQEDIESNGIVIVITDGDDQNSSLTANAVGKASKDALQSEHLESLISILVGVNVDNNLQTYLEKFKNDGGFTHFVAIDDVTDRKIAKLADFVSKSVSAQSASLGTGGPSQAIPLVI